MAFLEWLDQQETAPEKGLSFSNWLDKREEGIQEKQAELLAKAQEKVKYKFKSHIDNQPSKWTSEFWASLGEHMMETPGGQMLTKEYWTETGKNFLRQALEMQMEYPYGFQKRWTDRTMQLFGAHPKKDLAFSEWLETGGEDVPPIKAGFEEITRTAVDFALFMPRMALNIAKDPVKTIREDPLGTAFFITGVVGAKVTKPLMSKIKGKPRWMATGDFINPLKKSKMVSPKYKWMLRDVPTDIQFELPNQPLEIIKQKSKGMQPFYKHWYEGINKNIKKTGDLSSKFGGWHKYIGMRNPIRVFENYPWLKRVIYDDGAANVVIKQAEAKVWGRQIKAWKKKGINTKSQKRVGVYSEYMQEGGAEIMQAMKEKLPKLTPLEMKYYNWIRKTYDVFHTRINQVRTMAGEKPIGRPENYTTWIRNLSRLPELGIDIIGSPLEQIQHHLNSKPLAYAKPRKPGLVRPGIELNIGQVLETYINQALDHIHITPTIVRARTLLEPFTAQGWSMFKEAPRLATYLTEWTDTIAGLKNVIPGGTGGKIMRVANTLRRNFAVAILSFNFRSALIQPTALKLAYVYLGKDYLMRGFLDNLKKERRAYAMANSNHLPTRLFTIEQPEIMASQLGKKFVNIKQMMGRVGMKPLQLLDFETARVTWLGAEQLAREKFGYTKKMAARWADDVVVKTQASAWLGDIAPLQRTPYGKLLTMFQTFVINEWDFLCHDVIGYKNLYVNIKARSRSVGRFLMASVAINALYEGMFKLRSPYPAPEWAIKRAVDSGENIFGVGAAVVKELAEQLPIIGGTIRWSSPYRVAYPAFMQTGIIDPIQMYNRLLTKPKLSQDQLELLGKWFGIPGTSQVMKYIRRRKRGMTHLEAMVGIRSEDKKRRIKW